MRNSKDPSKKNFFFHSKNKQGIIFIEIMLALVILYSGITLLFKTYIYFIDKIGFLSNRLYVSVMLDNEIEKIDRVLRVYRAFPSEEYKKEKVLIGLRTVEFEHKLKIEEVDEFVDVFNVDVTYSWKEGNSTVSKSRSAYISDTLIAD